MSLPDRRTFVRITAGALYTTFVPSARPLSNVITPIGIQLYTLRDSMQLGVEATLEQVARIGYREVEFAGYFGRTPARIREILSGTGLYAPAAHLPFPALHTGWEAALEVAQAVGHRYVVIPWIPSEQRRTLDAYRRIAGLFNVSAERAHRYGLAFAYHNYDFEFTPMEGRIPFEVLLEETDPSLVLIELDLYWITKGGGDALALIERNPRRFPMVHLKDGHRDGRQTDLGEGEVDLTGFIAQRARAGIHHYFVEHDQPTDPMAFARSAYAHVREILP